MKKDFITLLHICILLFTFSSAHTQHRSIPDTVKQKWIGLTPVNKHTKIKALAIGLTPAFGFADEGYIKINGLNFELGAFGLLAGPFSLLYGFSGYKNGVGNRESFFSSYGYMDTTELNNTKYCTSINGLSISIGGITVQPSVNNGVFINGLVDINYISNGIQVTGLVNQLHKFNGILIGGISNKVQKANGLMIGLINNCQSGNVFQIGLFNRIGKRVIPFINCGFR